VRLEAAPQACITLLRSKGLTQITQKARTWLTLEMQIHVEKCTENKKNATIRVLESTDIIQTKIAAFEEC